MVKQAYWSEKYAGRVGTPFAMDSSSLGARCCLVQDATNTTQKGALARERRCSGGVAVGA